MYTLYIFQIISKFSAKLDPSLRAVIKLLGATLRPGAGLAYMGPLAGCEFYGDQPLPLVHLTSPTIHIIMENYAITVIVNLFIRHSSMAFGSVCVSESIWQYKY